MGDFRVVVDATGGHGCQRENGDGDKVFGCRRMNCPDCLTQEFVERMAKICSVNKAELIHWPGSPGSVVDEFVKPTMRIATYQNQAGQECNYIDVTVVHRVRHGNFPK